MDALNHNVKQEITNALDNKKETMFVVDGKLFFLEVHDIVAVNEKPDNLAQEIESHSELKESLQRFLENPDMKRYTAKELKDLRYGQRR